MWRGCTSCDGERNERKKNGATRDQISALHNRLFFYRASSFFVFSSAFSFLPTPLSLYTMAAAAVTARRPADKATMGGAGGCGAGGQAATDALLSAPASSSRATSASGLLALLSEPEPELVGAALRGLDAAVPQFWFEIAQSIGELEAAAEDEASPHRELASLVASKVID